MKIKKVLLKIVLLTILSLSTIGCSGSRTYYGEYTEKAGDHDYTTKVFVVTKGDVIQKVEIAPGSNHHTDPEYWEGATLWLEQEEAILASFEGKSVKEIRKSSENNIYDTVAGATLTSNRIYKAVQEALEINIDIY